MTKEPLQLGRYSLFAELASGGMATVYLGRLNSEVGFGRTVAIKRLHPHLAGEPQFVSMFLDEARLAARVQHPNVVPTLDVVTLGRELFLVMEYVKGESLSALIRATVAAETRIPVPIVASVVIGLLSGLHAAHIATDEDRRDLSIVHRDVSPHNVLVGLDGVARVLDFGIAKAAMRLHTTREPTLKGKLAYMAPEQVIGQVTQRSDIYAAGVVAWEALACRRLFLGETEAQLLRKVMDAEVEPASLHNPDVSPELDRIILKALAKNPDDRYATAREMAAEIDAALRPASAMAVSEWVQGLAGPGMAERSKLVAELESQASRPQQQPLVDALLRDSQGVASVEPLPSVGPGPTVAAPAALTPAPAVATARPPTNAEGSGRGSRNVVVGLVGAASLALAGRMLLWALAPTATSAAAVASSASSTPASDAAVVATASATEPLDEPLATATPQAPASVAARPQPEPPSTVRAPEVPAPPVATARKAAGGPSPRPPRPKSDDPIDPFRGVRK